MAREYPEQPVVGVGGVVIENDRALLIRRGTEPLLGQWSIPGGTLEVGESLQAGVARELLEETDKRFTPQFEEISGEDPAVREKIGRASCRERVSVVV